MGEQVRLVPLSHWEKEIKEPYRVKTLDGDGVAVRREIFGSSRIGVILDKNIYGYSPCYYFKEELL